MTADRTGSRNCRWRAAARWNRDLEFNRFLSFGGRYRTLPPLPRAEVAELVDALASGASGGNPVEVQILSSAPPEPRAFRTAQAAPPPAPGRPDGHRTASGSRWRPANRRLLPVPRPSAPRGPRPRMRRGDPSRGTYARRRPRPSRCASRGPVAAPPPPRPSVQGSSMPRWTAGRAISASYQRSTFGKSARSTSCQTWRNTQGRVAKSAIERSPARCSRPSRRASSTP